MTLNIILDDLKFDYTDVELVKFRHLWNEYRINTDNSSEIINQLAEDLNMEADNVALLAMDQTRKGKI